MSTPVIAVRISTWLDGVVHPYARYSGGLNRAIYNYRAVNVGACATFICQFLTEAFGRSCAPSCTPIYHVCSQINDAAFI